MERARECRAAGKSFLQQTETRWIGPISRRAASRKNERAESESALRCLRSAGLHKQSLLSRGNAVAVRTAAAHSCARFTRPNGFYPLLSPLPHLTYFLTPSLPLARFLSSFTSLHREQLRSPQLFVRLKNVFSSLPCRFERVMYLVQT